VGFEQTSGSAGSQSMMAPPFAFAAKAATGPMLSVEVWIMPLPAIKR